MSGRTPRESRSFSIEPASCSSPCTQHRGHKGHREEFFSCVLGVLCVEYTPLKADAGDYRIANQLKLPTLVPLAPLASITIRTTCVPAARVTPVLVTVFHTCQPVVSGTAIGPVLSTPFTSMWN